MNFKKGDIVIKNTSQGETVWLSQRYVSEITNILNEVFRSPIRRDYKKTVQPCHRHHNVLPDTGKGWRWAKINGQFYYDLARIPDRKPKYYRSLFGDAQELVNQYQEATKNQSKNLFELEFKNYIQAKYTEYLPCYFQNTAIQAAALAKACAVIEFIIVYKSDNETKTKAEIYKKVADLVAKYDLKYVGKQYRTIQQKVEKVENEGLGIAEIIELPRAGNNNAVQYLDDTEIYGWAMQLRACGMNYSNETIIRMIRKQCQLVGKPEPSRRWFGTTIFETHHTKFLTSSLRFGKGTSRGSVHDSYVPKQSAIHAGDCWQIDATRMNLIAHKRVIETIDKSTGEIKENTVDGFLFVIAVKDVHSGDILGYNFDYSENRWSVTNAIKMAVQEAGYLPYQMIFDRFPGHNTDEVKTLFANLRMLGVKVEISHDANTKASVERGFGTIQSVFMQPTAFYYGEGVKSRRDNAHRSPEMLKQMRQQANKERFDFIAAWNESAAIIEAYRTTDLSYYSRKHAKVNESPKMLHAKSDKPNVIDLKKHTISMLFDLKTTFKVKHNGMILKEINHLKVYYQIQDYKVFSKHPDVWLSYDLEDLSTAYVFAKTDDLYLYLCEAHQIEEPQLYGPNAEFNKLNKLKQDAKAIEAQKAAELEEITLGNEVSLMMGRYTQKQEAEMADSARIIQESKDMKIEKTLKKAVGDSLDDDTYSEHNDSSGFDIENFMRSQL